MERIQMTDEQVFKALEVLTHQVGRRLEKHGYGIFASKHEIYGVVAEEMHELTEELRRDDLTRFAEELMDIGVACVIGLASMTTGKRAAIESTNIEVQMSEESAPSEVINQTMVEDLAKAARDAMKARAAQSNLVIPD